MKVFISVASLRPSYGGPAYSVSRLAAALANAGVEVGLWAADQSAKRNESIPTASSVRHLTGCAADALARFGLPDVLHDNGLWLPHNHRLAGLARQQGIPRVVSTRGMLEPWAYNHKRWKKSLAWRLYQRRDLAAADGHHATSELEAANLARFDLGVPTRVISNGVDVPETVPGARCERGTRTALFLGRIYPVKGLPMLVEAWSRVQPACWRLIIAGPDEASHRAEVERAVSVAGLQHVVSFAGSIEAAAKADVLFDADLLILPSHSENFGLVVAEALAHGLPVLTTTGAPWPGLLERDCGWWVDPTVEGVAEGLRQATSQDAATLKAMGARGRAWVAAEFGWDAIAKQFLAAYEQVLARDKSIR